MFAAITNTAIPKPAGAIARWKNNIFKVIGKTSRSANGINVPDKKNTPQITCMKAINGRKYWAFTNP